jgi:hypothetical protein
MKLIGYGLAVLAIALMPAAASAQEAVDWAKLDTSAWKVCDEKCSIEAIDASSSVVILHDRGELSEAEAKALYRAIERGLKVEFFVGESNSVFEEMRSYAADIYEKWSATAPDDDTSMIGMGGCVMPAASKSPDFLALDPLVSGAAIVIVNNKISHDQVLAEAVSVASETEDFIQCKLH